MNTTRTTVKFNWAIPWRPFDESDDMWQRDAAAESARQWAKRQFPDASADVESVNRGRKNLVVSVAITRYG